MLHQAKIAQFRLSTFLPHAPASTKSATGYFRERLNCAVQTISFGAGLVALLFEIIRYSCQLSYDSVLGVEYSCECCLFGMLCRRQPPRTANARGFGGTK